MHIEVDRLTEAGESLAHTYAPEELQLDDERLRLADHARVSVYASRKGEQVRLRGNLSASVEAHCDRCLRPILAPIKVEFDTSYVPAEAVRGEIESTELQENDLDVSFYEGQSINVDDLMREQVLLALPIRLLCRENCRGLCAVCGADLNEETCACQHKEVDSRWATLAGLKEKQS